MAILKRTNQKFPVQKRFFGDEQECWQWTKLNFQGRIVLQVKYLSAIFGQQNNFPGSNYQLEPKKFTAV